MRSNQKAMMLGGGMVSSLMLPLMASSSLMPVELLSKFGVNGVEAALALDFIGSEYRTGNTATTFADAFTGTNPKLTYSTAAGSNSTMTQGYGPELVNNGGFDTDTDWTKGSGWTISGGVATKAAGISSVFEQLDVVPSSGRVSVTFDATRTAGVLYVRAGGNTNQASVTASGSYELILDTQGVDTKLRFVADGSFAGSIDNISVREAPKIVWAPHNLALNSATPTTQTITVRSDAQYTVRVTGTGSMALSGAGTGTATDGSPATITASTTSLTITLTGSLDTVAVYRSDLGGMHPVPGAATGFEYYVPTNGNAEYLPRVGHHVYNGSTWVNEGLLIESEPRTNLVTYSNSNWVAINAGTADENNATGPDGETSATLYTPPAATGIRGIATTAYTSATGTLSVYIKSNGIDTVSLWHNNGAIGTVAFNLLTGETSVANGLDGYGMEDVGNGWWRCFIYSSTYATQTVRIYGGVGSAVAYNGTDGFYVYGAQHETAPTPSSYMPTSGGTYTRTAQSLTVPAHWYDADNPTYTGPELVGGSDGSDASDWSAARSNSTVTSDGVRIRSTSTAAGSYGPMQQLTGLTVGNVYRYTADVFTAGGAGTYYFRITAVADLNDTQTVNETSSTDFSPEGEFVATNSTMYVGVIHVAAAAGDYVEIDNISVRQVSAPQFGWPEPEYIGPALYTSDFSATVDGWTAQGQGTIAAVSSELEVTGDGGYNDAGQKQISTVAGKHYVVRGKIRTGTSSAARLQVREAFGSFGVATAYLSTSSTLEDFTLYFTASGTAYNLQLNQWSGAGGTIYIKDISVREINPLSVSMQMDGRMTYADEGVSHSQAGRAGTAVFYTHWSSSSDYLESVLSTSGTRTGSLVVQNEEAGSGDDRVLSAEGSYSPGVLVPFNISSRHGSTFVNGAVDGVVLTEDTTPTVLPDLSNTNLEIAPDFMGTIGTFRQFAGDIGDAGLVTATNPSTEPTLSLTFDGTGGSFYNLSWSE